MAEPAADPEAEFFEREMRKVRAANRAWAERSRLGAFTGAWGAVTGFALFIVIEESLEIWWLPVLAVVLATGAAAVVEWLRHLAEGHPSQRPTLPGALSSLALLLVLELFIFAFHDLAKSPAEWLIVLDHIFGAMTARGIFSFAAFVILWVLLGANLGAMLAQSIPRMSGWTLGNDIWIGLKKGLLAGFVYLPLIVFAYAIAVRLGWATVEHFAGGRREWLLAGETGPTYALALIFVFFIGGLLADFLENGRFVSAALVLLYAGLQVFRWLAGDSTGELAKFGARLWEITVFALQTGAIWAAPAIVLGVLTPFLRKPSQYPWLWSPVALGAAAIAVVLVFLQQSPWPLALAAALVVAGLVLRTRAQLDELWPLIAATVATVAFLAMVAVLHLAPLSVYRNLHAIVIPPGIGQSEWTFLEPRLRDVQNERDNEKRLDGYAALDEWIRTFNPNAGWDTLPIGSRPQLVDVDREAMERYVEESRALDEAVLGIGHGKAERFVPRGTTFSLATVSALAFWLTLGLLAVWQVERAREKREPAG